MPIVERICQNCEKTFHIQQSRVKDGRGKHCSVHCQHESTKDRIAITCQWCGKDFDVPKSRWGRKHCSPECSHEHRSKRTTIAVPCDVCGQIMQRKRHQIEAYKYNICSNKCLAKHFKMRRLDPSAPYTKANRKGHPYSSQRKCEKCGKEFHARPYQRFCSKDCQRNRVIVNCSNCGQQLERLVSKTKNFQHVFCDRKCKSEFEIGPNSSQWAGGLSTENELARKSKEYNEWRIAVFKRDDYACQDCKVRGGKLHAHHLYEFVLYFHLRFIVENGRTLCKKCHDKIRGHEKEYRESLFAITPIHIPGV